MLNVCPFCRTEITTASLWENTHYRVVADEYPRCIGHLLVLSKAHYPSHMHAPIEQLSELEFAQCQARQFLLDNFGRASFLENGGVRQEVPHAHLHSVPVTASIPPSWIERGILKRVEHWRDVWREREQTGHYCYVETAEGRFVLRGDSEDELLLNEMRSQVIAQTTAEIDPETGALKRGDRDMVTETIRVWKTWAQTKQISPGI
jgi:diadenosine tetraphosphate (Ap4A) HIT family hydrolase